LGTAIETKLAKLFTFFGNTRSQLELHRLDVRIFHPSTDI